MLALREELGHDAQSCRLIYLWILGRLVGILVKTWECIENRRKELIIQIRSSACCSSRTSKMLSLTPRGDDHGAWHWYWTRGLMPPVELPVPVRSADAWTDSMVVQSMPGLQELVRHGRSEHNRDWGPCGTEMPSLWQLSVASRTGAQPGVSTQGKQRWTKQEGRRDAEAWSEWAITAIKVQIQTTGGYTYLQTQCIAGNCLGLAGTSLRSRRWAQTITPWRESPQVRL